MVKESRHTRTVEEELFFHRKGLVTQKAAEELANRFNAEAEGLGLVGLPKVRTTLVRPLHGARPLHRSAIGSRVADSLPSTWQACATSHAPPLA